MPSDHSRQRAAAPTGHGLPTSAAAAPANAVPSTVPSLLGSASVPAEPESIEVPPLAPITNYVTTEGDVLTPGELTDAASEAGSDYFIHRPYRYAPSKRAADGPLARTVIKTLRSEEGREDALQLLQSILLFVHSALSRSLGSPPLLGLLGPSPRRRRARLLRPLYLLSEGTANARHVFVLGRWAFEGARNALAAAAGADRALAKADLKDGKNKQLQQVNEKVQDESSSSSEDDAPAKVSSRAQPRAQAVHQQQKSMFSIYRRAFELMTTVLGTASEACDLVAFLAGSGLAWRIGKRRRQGLERLSIWLGLAALPSALALQRMLYERARRRARAAHERVLQAIDQEDDAPARPEPSSGLGFPGLSHERMAVVRAEGKLRKARREVRALRWEQRAILADAIFIVYEALRPDKDKQFVESLSGIASSLIRISLLCAAS